MIDQLIESKGFSRNEIVDLLGVSRTVIDNICTGRSKLKNDRLRKLASILNMSESDLRAKIASARTYSIPLAKPLQIAETVRPLTVTQPETVNVRGKIIIVPEGKKPVPIYGGVPAGLPGRSFSDAIDVEFVNISSTGPLWGRTVEGASMEDEFKQSDIVIFEEVQPQRNQIIYATRDGEEAFKILREDKDGNGWLQPLNTDGYEKFSAEDWQVHGVVRARIRYYANGIRETREYPVHMTWRIPEKRA